MKEQKLEERIAILASDIHREQEHWIYVQKNGCNDPFWCDGMNMNLTRNHIIYDKAVIAEICSETGFLFPEEYFIPTPPEVSDCYMANLKQKERCKRLRCFVMEFERKCPDYDTEQMSLF